MPTTSITKEFTVKDVARYQKLKEEIKQSPVKEIKIVQPSNIEKGRELLKSFSFR